MTSKSATAVNDRIATALDCNEAILGVCIALLADTRLDAEERKLCKQAAKVDTTLVDNVIESVELGDDPLGEAYMRVNGASERRGSGSVYTPIGLVRSMLGWSSENIVPGRVVDCGCGSGRFAVAAARMFPDAEIVAIDLSPMATLMCKAHAAAAGVQVTVLRRDFTEARLPFRDAGPTLWIGNPPYVRHHNISPEQKKRYTDTLAGFGFKGSALAGLHAHFTASIAKRIRKGDVGCLVLSAEWMDVGYGSAIRRLLTTKIPLRSICAHDKATETFEGTMSSAVVIGFGVGTDGMVDVAGRQIPLSDFSASEKWSEVVAGKEASVVPDGYVRLGDIASVHRGIVTGRNSFWVRKRGDVSEELCCPVVAHARELSGASPACRDIDNLARLVTLPDDLATLPEGLRSEAEGIVADGLASKVDEGYVAGTRRTWWSIKPNEPPAIMMTYMARHAPVFVVNEDNLAMLNVVHGIYPKTQLSKQAIGHLTAYLNNHVEVGDGRTYSGGLTKFEPREVERLVVPCVEALEEGRYA